jgi:hypothetical protein
MKQLISSLEDERKQLLVRAREIKAAIAKLKRLTGGRTRKSRTNVRLGTQEDCCGSTGTMGEVERGA